MMPAPARRSSRTHAAHLLLLAMLCLSLIALPARADGEAQEADSPTMPLDEALAHRVTVDWEGVTFDAALQDLGEQLGVRIVIDPAVIELGHLQNPNELTLLLENMPFASVMQYVLTQANSQGTSSPFSSIPVRPEWRISNGALVLAMPELEMRVYDIRDLILPMQTDTTRPPMTQDEALAMRAELVEQVTELLRTACGANPAHWSEQYRDTDLGGTMTELNGNLIVRTTAANHQGIASILETIRAPRGIMTQFEARLLLLDTQTFTQVFSEQMPDIQWRATGLEEVPSDRLGLTRGVSAIAFLTNEQAQSLLTRTADAGGPNVMMALPRHTHFNGQRTWIKTAAQTAYLSHFERPQVITGEFVPHIDTAETGVLWIAESTVSADRQYVTLTTQLQLATTLGEPVYLPVAGSQPRVNVMVPQIDRADLQTTVSMPDQTWLMLVGPPVHGVFDIGFNEAQDPANYDLTRRAVFLIRPTIQIEQVQEAEGDGEAEADADGEETIEE